MNELKIKVLDREPLPRRGDKGPVHKRQALLYRDVEGETVPQQILIAIWQQPLDVAPGIYTVDVMKALRVSKYGDTSLQFDRSSLVPVK